MRSRRRSGDLYGKDPAGRCLIGEPRDLGSRLLALGRAGRGDAPAPGGTGASAL